MCQAPWPKAASYLVSETHYRVTQSANPGRPIDFKEHQRAAFLSSRAGAPSGGLLKNRWDNCGCQLSGLAFPLFVYSKYELTELQPRPNSAKPLWRSTSLFRERYARLCPRRPVFARMSVKL